MQNMPIVQYGCSIKYRSHCHKVQELDSCFFETNSFYLEQKGKKENKTIKVSADQVERIMMAQH
jgi:hypothetical protein